MGKAYEEELGSGNPVRLLADLPVLKSDGFSVWSDYFQGNSMGAIWSKVSWFGNNLPTILPPNYASVDTTISQVGAVRDAFSPIIKVANAYQLEIFCVPWAGEWNGHYLIFARMDDTTPAAYTDGIVVDLVMVGSTGALTGTLYSYDSDGADEDWDFSETTGPGSAKPGWLKVLITGTNVKVYWHGVELFGGAGQTLPAAVGQRVGFGLQCTVTGGVAAIESFRNQHYVDDTAERTRSILIASANGELWRETLIGKMEKLTTNATLASDRPLQAIDHTQKLYIADNGPPLAEAADGVVNVTAQLDSATYADWTALGLSIYDHVVVLTNATGNTVAGTYKMTVIAVDKITLDPDPGDGNCSFRIERGPKIYDPAADTLDLWTATATKGQVPTGCHIINRYHDRIVLCQENTWYMSRAGDPLDWDYLADPNDPGMASSGGTSDAGDLPKTVHAFMPYSDDYAVFGCLGSTWVLRGDPVFGGRIDNISYLHGCVDKFAWTATPDGGLLYLTDDGLYHLARGAAQAAESISREDLPLELLNLDNANYTISMAYDSIQRGVHIFLTSGAEADVKHWWFDMRLKALYPDKYPTAYEPTATLFHRGDSAQDNRPLIGGRDGYIRQFDPVYETDDGTEIASHVVLGPFALAKSLDRAGSLLEVFVQLGLVSGPVDWEVRVGDNHEAAVKNSAFDSGSFSAAGQQYRIYPRAGGGSALLRLSNNAARAWALEHSIATIEEMGKQRMW